MTPSEWDVAVVVLIVRGWHQEGEKGCFEKPGVFFIIIVVFEPVPTFVGTEVIIKTAFAGVCAVGDVFYDGLGFFFLGGALFGLVHLREYIAFVVEGDVQALHKGAPVPRGGLVAADGELGADVFKQSVGKQVYLLRHFRQYFMCDGFV